jgi:hypothetical protein
MRDLLRGALGLAGVAIALLCCGCGSSASTNSHARSPKGTSTKAQFVASAESICGTLSAQEKPLRARQESLKKLPMATADKEFVALVRQVVAFSHAAYGKLQLLSPPAGDAGTIEKLLSSFSSETNDAKAIASAASRQESDIGEAAEEALKKSVARSSTLAAEYGMKDCIGSE